MGILTPHGCLFDISSLTVAAIATKTISACEYIIIIASTHYVVSACDVCHSSSLLFTKREDYLHNMHTDVDNNSTIYSTLPIDLLDLVVRGNSGYMVRLFITLWPWHLSNESGKRSADNLLYHGTVPMKAENGVLIINYTMAPSQWKQKMQC